MASVLCIVELVGDRAHPASLEALGLGRRVGSALGATVYAVVPCRVGPGYGDDELIAVLSRAGADKIMLAVSPAHAGPLRWGAHGPAIASACQVVRPTLVLLAGTHGGRDVTGRLGARLGAACLIDATVEIAEDDVLLGEGAGAATRRLEGDLDFAVVAQLAPGRYEPARGDEEAEVEMLEVPARERDFEERGEGEAGAIGLAIGDAGAVEDVGRALGSVPAPEVAPPLVVAEARAAAELDRFTAATKVAVGEGAAAAGEAHYALETPPADLARAVGEALDRAKVPEPK